MSSSLFTAVSGIKANQTNLSVISNNIANVNTTGFKSSTAQFAQLFANTITGGGAPTGTIGGTNPEQIGLGTTLSAINTNFAQGGNQYTGRPSDLMINGNGFFAVQQVNSNLGSSNTSYYLTRAGNWSPPAAKKCWVHPSLKAIARRRPQRSTFLKAF
jgi:flagellar hook protein FlgE